MTTVLKTSSLGVIQGKNADGVNLYLGIRYAKLRNRLAEAELIQRSNENINIATRAGPGAPSIPNGCEVEQAQIQHHLPTTDLHQSDLDCLNLNIAVPENFPADSKLPVFIFIHGGGFFMGANSWPQYDQARFIKLSNEKGYPIISVLINYRLGVFGFMTSEELRQAGYKANNGFRDQKAAISWIYQNIREFGGDPENMTLAGMSAGAASVTQHICSGHPFFKRAIAMSGSNLLMGQLPPSIHEEAYQHVINAWGLQGLKPEQRVQAILETPFQELIAKLPPAVPFSFAVDGDLITSAVSHKEIGNKLNGFPKETTWCRELLIGDAEADASIFSFLMQHLKQDGARKFIEAVKQALVRFPTEALELPRSYGIAGNTPDEEAFEKILCFLNDVGFFAPVLTYARGWNGNAYVYHFNEGNPWDGPWKDRANHILDVAFLFQNFSEFLDVGQQAVASAFAEDVFKFCYGVSPWHPVQWRGDPSSSRSFARTYGRSKENTFTNLVSQATFAEARRRSILHEYAKTVPLDDLAKVLVILQSSR